MGEGQIVSAPREFTPSPALLRPQTPKIIRQRERERRNEGVIHHVDSGTGGPIRNGRLNQSPKADSISYNLGRSGWGANIKAKNKCKLDRDLGGPVIN